MRIDNKYKNKLFSILGDSISTLDGYSVPRDAVFYRYERGVAAGVLSPSDTWWGQVIDRLGGELLVNNSISGSMVTKHPCCDIPSYSCSDERTSALSRDGVSPDVIIIFMGINDWGWGVSTVPQSGENASVEVFSTAYEQMLKKLGKSYPKADIWCLTLPVSTCARLENFEFPYSYAGKHIEEYNDVIRSVASAAGCRVIDVYRPSAPHDTVDGFHPTASGMSTLAEAVLAYIECGE